MARYIHTVYNIVYMLGNKDIKNRNRKNYMFYHVHSNLVSGYFHHCLVCSDSFLGTFLLLVGGTTKLGPPGSCLRD